MATIPATTNNINKIYHRAYYIYTITTHTKFQNHYNPWLKHPNPSNSAPFPAYTTSHTRPKTRIKDTKNRGFPPKIKNFNHTTPNTVHKTTQNYT